MLVKKASFGAALLLGLTSPIVLSSPATALAPTPAPIEEQQVLLAPTATLFLECDGINGNYRYSGMGTGLSPNAEITQSFDLTIVNPDLTQDTFYDRDEVRVAADSAGNVATGSFVSTSGGDSYRSVVVTYRLVNQSGQELASTTQGCGSPSYL